MQFTIKKTNITLSLSLEQFINRKIANLERLLEPGLIATPSRYKKSLIRASLEIGKPSRRHRKDSICYAELQLRLPGKSFRTESYNWDLKLAVNEVHAEMQRKLKEYKEKWIARSRRKRRALKRSLRFANGAALPKGKRVREEAF